MFTKNIDKALLFDRCNSIHTFFMKMNIDAVYLDHNMKVISVMPCIDTGKIMPKVKNARSVLELPEGMADKYGIRTGDILSVMRAATE